LYILLDPLDFTVVDIGFVISATSVNADTVHKLIKDSIKSIVSNHFSKNIRYGIVVFGSQPRTILEFGEALPSIDLLTMRIDGIQREFGSPDMLKALQAGKELFERRGSRPHSRKFLVVILDNRVRQMIAKMGPEAKKLEMSGIRVIPIAIGQYTYPFQLQSITPLVDNIIEVPKTEDSTMLGEKIIDKIQTSKYSFNRVLIISIFEWRGHENVTDYKFKIIYIYNQLIVVVSDDDADDGGGDDMLM